MQPRGEGNFWQPQSEASPPLAAPLAPAPLPDDQPAPNDVLSWQASEYVHHEKERLWFVLLFVGALILLAVAFFLVKSITFSILIVVMTIVLAVYAVRPPRIINYQLTTAGIQINEKMFRFADFRYFGVVQDGPLYSAVLVPNKRFMPAVNIYFPSEDGELIVDILGSRLPMQHVELDTVEKLVRHLRF